MLPRICATSNQRLSAVVYAAADRPVFAFRVFSFDANRLSTTL